MAKTEFFMATQEIFDLGDKLIATHHPEALDAHIMYMFRSKAGKSGGKTRLASCYLASELQKAVHGYNYIIEIAADEWDHMEQQQREALLLHEILHIGAKEDEKTGAVTWGLRKHDTEEFRKVVEVYGIWTGDLEEMAKAIRAAEEK